MFGSTYLGRPLGINLYVHGTFWLLPAFVLLSGLADGPVAAAVDVAVVLALFGCVALHELGHAAAARLFGIGTREITLYPIGGVARLDRMPARPLHEVVVALAGPAVNVAIVAALLPLMWLDGYPLHPAGPFESVADAFWNRVLWGNVALVVFNMIPAFPMDGGRVLRATLAAVVGRRSGTEMAATIGMAFAVLFGLVGLGLVRVPFLGASPTLAVLGLFLFFAARGERDAVRAEDAERRYRERYGWDEPAPRVTVFDVPVARPARRPAALDGWVFDAAAGVWVYYRNGVPVRHAPPG
jgi:Zn-dependent protease